MAKELWNVEIGNGRIDKVAVFNLNGKENDDREWNKKSDGEQPMSGRTWGEIRMGEGNWYDWYDTTKEGAELAKNYIGKDIPEDVLHKIYDECNKAGANINY